jgi:hypothetical protein
MYYSECEKRFLKVSFNNIRDFVATRSRFNKNADMKASYDSKNPPFLQLIHTLDLPTSAWITLENTRMSPMDLRNTPYRHRQLGGRFTVHRSARRHGTAEGRIF